MTASGDRKRQYRSQRRRRCAGGVLIVAGARNLSFAFGPGKPALPAGTYDVLDNCFVNLVLELPAGDNETTVMHFREPSWSRTVAA